MSDLVERLREYRDVPDERWPDEVPICIEAANEIKRLRSVMQQKNDAISELRHLMFWYRDADQTQQRPKEKL